MNQRYNVPAIHTATFPAHLTENFSHSPQTCSDIIRAAERRTQNAERRTQNAERRTQNAERRTQNAERTIKIRKEH